MQKVHITVQPNGRIIFFTEEKCLVDTNIADVTLDFDDAGEETFFEHQFSEMIATYQAMQKAIEILKA